MTKTCANCGETVSDDFARVFGDNSNELANCPHCPDIAFRDLGDGAGADLDAQNRGIGVAIARRSR